MDELRRIFGVDDKDPESGEYLQQDVYFYTCNNKTDLDVCTDLNVQCFTKKSGSSVTVMTYELAIHDDYTRMQ